MVYSPIGSVSTSSLIGVGIACGGNVLISLALTIQKLAHRRNEEQVHARYLASQNDQGNEADDTGSALGAPSPIPEEEEEEEEGIDSGETSTSTAAGTPSPSPGRHKTSSRSRSPRSFANRDGSSSQTLTAVPVVLVPERTNSGTSQLALHLAPSPSTSPHPNLTTPDSITQHRNDGNDSATPTREDGDDGDDGKENAAQHSGEVEEGMYLKSKLWWAGMVLIAIGEGGNFLSYGFAPASVVAPLGTVALIANCVFAPLILREQFHKKELIGMALAIIGAVTVVWSSNSANPRLDPPQLLTALSRLPFVLYTILNFLLLSLFLFLSSTSHGQRYIVIDVGICALFGGYTVLATKALSSLLSNDFFGAWEWGITWGMVAVVGVTSLGQIRWLNRALMRFQSKEVIPTQFVFFSLAAIIGSAVLYQEFRDVPFSHFINFAFGIATTFLGVHLLTSSQPSSEDENPDEADAEPADPTAPPLPRISSSRSVNLLLPTSISAVTERTPLVSNPSFTPALNVRRPSEIPTNTLFSPPNSGGVGPGTTRIRLSSRTSTTDFSTPTLGLGSQAGFLLMATTPPGPGFFGPGRRGRSASRAGPGGWDEESGRRVSGLPR
nr:uncharacterized protein CI109_006300 [Kwoniella shandongensis]KAA5525401.1 hypothetical protein CI109_006300 [Kwoniella shandongensis]